MRSWAQIAAGAQASATVGAEALAPKHDAKDIIASHTVVTASPHSSVPNVDCKVVHVVQAQVDDAVKKGAKVVCGGKLENHGGGTWMNATVLTNCNHTMEVMMEETFGPVMPIMKYKTVEEAFDKLVQHIDAEINATCIDEESLSEEHRPTPSNSILSDSSLIFLGVENVAEQLTKRMSTKLVPEKVKKQITTYLHEKAKDPAVKYFTQMVKARDVELDNVTRAKCMKHIVNIGPQKRKRCCRRSNWCYPVPGIFQ